jgi:uncharacterized integral membrane protein (TIGR00698 family)
MRSSTVAIELARLWAPDNLRRAAPGVALCAAIAAVAFVADTRDLLRFGPVWVPPLILTLVFGMALQPLSGKPALKPGLEFAGRTLLRVGVALYGARLTLGQLVDGGALPVLIALAAVACTIAFGAWAARLCGLSRDFGLLTGCATGVCGAAAAMAASAVLPKHANSDRDLAFTVMGVNFISTVVMVIYPTLHQMLGYSLFEMGVFLGGAIHDVAQVAGAGQTMGPQVLADAIITKLLRVAFLLPAIAGIAWCQRRRSGGGCAAGPAGLPVRLFGAGRPQLTGRGAARREGRGGAGLLVPDHHRHCRARHEDLAAGAGAHRHRPGDAAGDPDGIHRPSGGRPDLRVAGVRDLAGAPAHWLIDVSRSTQSPPK